MEIGDKIKFSRIVYVHCAPHKRVRKTIKADTRDGVPLSTNLEYYIDPTHKKGQPTDLLGYLESRFGYTPCELFLKHSPLSYHTMRLRMRKNALNGHIKVNNMIDEIYFSSTLIMKLPEIQEGIYLGYKNMILFGVYKKRQTDKVTNKEKETIERGRGFHPRGAPTSQMSNYKAEYYVRKNKHFDRVALIAVSKTKRVYVPMYDITLNNHLITF